MGSGNSGLYKSLAQSVNKGMVISVPAKALRHASVGEYTKNSNRLKSGCHSQDGIEELKRRNIKYVIVKTYPNGVRLGYIPDHLERRKRGLGKNQIGQLWFPKGWTDKDIRDAGAAILKSYKGKIKDGDTITGWYNKVKVGVIIRNKQTNTIFPAKEQE